jgi:hypothetical protein
MQLRSKWLCLYRLDDTFATLFMVGVIWLVQIVHYPLYHHIHAQSFPDYEVQHVNKITLVVAPVMFIEATTALILVVRAPAGFPLWCAIARTGAGHCHLGGNAGVERPPA